MEWYVLHVLTGSEPEVYRQLLGKGYEARYLRETCYIRRGGKWHEEVRTCLPGYVFARLEYTPLSYHMLKGIAGVIGILPREQPQPLDARETGWLMWMGDILRPSKVDFSGRKPRIIDGPLLKLKPYIVKFDRHGRRAHLRLPVLDTERDMALSILPV